MKKFTAKDLSNLTGTSLGWCKKFVATVRNVAAYELSIDKFKKRMKDGESLDPYYEGFRVMKKIDEEGVIDFDITIDQEAVNRFKERMKQKWIKEGTSVEDQELELSRATFLDGFTEIQSNTYKAMWVIDRLK